jgi:hypothetical protein
MAAEVELDVIIEALEMADDSISSYLDVETGEVHSITEEEFDLAEDPQTAIEDLPNWQREAVTLARRIQKQEDKRYMALPDKFDVHEWAMMDRFSMTLRDAQMRNDFHDGIRGAGVPPIQTPTHRIRLVGRLESVQASRTSADGHSNGVKRTALPTFRLN